MANYCFVAHHRFHEYNHAPLRSFLYCSVREPGEPMEYQSQIKMLGPFGGNQLCVIRWRYELRDHSPLLELLLTSR